MRKRKLAALVLCAISLPPALAQETEMKDEKTAEELELAAAVNRQKTAEAELAEATARKSLRELSLPDTETEGFEGTITVKDGAGYYAEILAFRALTDLTDEIAGDIKGDVEGKQVIVSTSFDIADQFVLWSLVDTRLKNVKLQLDALLTDYRNDDGDPRLLRRESVSGALTAAPLLLGAITDIAKFFKKDRQQKKVTVELSNNAMSAAMARSLAEFGGPPSSVTLQSINISYEGQLIERVQEILARHAEAVDLKEQLRQSLQPELLALAELRLQIAQKKAELGKEKDASKKTALQDQINELEAQELIDKQLEVNWRLAAARFDQVTSAATTLVDAIAERPSGKASVLETVAAVDTIKAQPEAFLLLLEISSKGGEVETVKGALFTRGKISYLGGAVISFVLLDKDGRILNSGVYPYHRVEQVKSLLETKEE